METVKQWILHRFVLASSDFTLAKEGSHSESLYVVYGDYAYRHNADMYEPKQFAIGLAKAEAYLKIPADESKKALEMRLHPEETEIEKQIYDFLGKKSKVKAKSLFDCFFQLIGNNEILRGCVLPVYNKANRDIEDALTSLRSPNVFGFYVIEPSDLADEPTPAWDEALNRIEPPWMREVFLATVWSALEPRASTRTIIWMTGPGGCGKSALLAVISSWFPEISKEFPHGVDNDKHTACQLEGKSIITLSDCKNPRIHENQVVRNYSGNDTAVADRKGESAYDVRIGFGNVFVNSSLMPEFDVHDEATATRVFPCKMRQVDKTVKKSSKYQDRLRLEKKGFLFKCKKAFENIYLSKDRKDVAFSPERPQSYIEWTKDNCGKRKGDDFYEFALDEEEDDFVL